LAPICHWPAKFPGATPLRRASKIAPVSPSEAPESRSGPLFEDLTDVAAQACNAPIALISLIDQDGEQIKASLGLDAGDDVRDLPFHRYALPSDDLFVALDAALDKRFRDAPVVAGPSAIRFYAGAPLITPQGDRLGVLCVMDRTPRAAFTEAEAKRLKTIARSVAHVLVLQRQGQERDRIAEVLAERNRLLSLAEEMAGIGTWSLDLTTQRTTWSDEVYRIHGLEPGSGSPDLAGAIACYHPDDAKVMKSLIKRAINQGVEYALSARIFRPDGAERNVQTHGACRRDADGKVVGLFGTFQDITELVRAEQFVRTVTDGLPGMVAYWDSALRCRFANASYREWFGRNPEGMIGITMPELMGDELFARNEPFIRGAMRGEPQTFERTLVKPSGEVGYTLARYIPDVEPSGHVRGMYVLVSDVSDLKRAQEQLQQANAEMTRVARISALGAFSASLAHEINQPLAALITNSETASRWLSRDPPELDMARQAIERSERDARRASEIVGRLRAMVTKGASEVADFDLRDAITEVLALTKVEQERSNVVVALDLAKSVSPVRGDRIQIQQVLLNLILNAIEAMADTPIAARLLNIRMAALESGQVRVEVSDSGSGVDPAAAEKIFDRLYTTKSGGTGVGLAISKSIIEDHGGRIWVEPASPRGSVFSFQIPSQGPEVLPG
jgi:PAS domain S-box-containing protein